MNKSEFRENVVVITGASFGIGRELALTLAAQGAWLVLAARTTERLEEISQQCIQKGARVKIVPTDVSIKSQCKHLIDETIKEFGRLDTLINNAGVGLASRFQDLNDLSVFEKIIQVNFFGSVYCTHYALPFLRQTRGRLVGISSLRGKFPSATADGYGASKHAMAGFFDSLRIELSGTGVTVTMIYPGWVSTGITSRALKADGTQLGKILKYEYNAMPVETCTRLIIGAITKRQRELIMTLQGKLGLWFKLISPSLIDKMTKKSTG